MLKYKVLKSLIPGGVFNVTTKVLYIGTVIAFVIGK